MQGETDNGAVAVERAVLQALTLQGLPLTARPFAALGRELALDESAALAAARALRAARTVRSLGAVFDPAAIGYHGTLAALPAGEARAEEVAVALSEHPAVTHVFERDDRYDVWFVAVAEGAGHLRAIVNDLMARAGAREVLELPDERVLKLTVDFTSGDGGLHGTTAALAPAGLRSTRPAPVTLSREERALVRMLQTDLPLVEHPFRDLAVTLAECGYDVDEAWVLERIAEWSRTGALRSVPAVVHAHRTSLPVVALALWPFSEGGSHASTAGAALAVDPAVTHCYRVPPALVTRPTVATLIHGAVRPHVEATVARLRQIPGLDAPRVSYAVRESKRAAARYFTEGEG